jgi:oxygen-independent coproporphyrinogen-3 oxidase
MAGIYIHIPFCKQACHYCKFSFATSLRHKNELIAALLKEIELQKSYLNNETIETIYFGGGTPSLFHTV